MDDYYNATNEKIENDSNYRSEPSSDHDYLRERKYSKKILSRCGWYIFLVIIAISAVQVLAIALSENFFNKFYESDWFELTVNALGVWGAGVPLAYILMKRLPVSVNGEVKNLPFRKLMEYFMVCYAASVLLNIVTVFISSLISSLKGSDVINPLESVFSGSNMFIIILYVSILGPIAEELIFRKFLLDRLRRFGDLPAILISGMAFGLFHMNVLQLFYTTAVGIILGYVTVKTNTVRNSILIHMMFNFFNIALTVTTGGGNNILSGFFGLCGVVFVISGTLLLVRNTKKIKLDNTVMPILMKRDYIFNSGTIAYIILCMTAIVAEALM